MISNRGGKRPHFSLVAGSDLCHHITLHVVNRLVAAPVARIDQTPNRWQHLDPNRYKTASQTLPTFVTTKRVKNPEDTIYMADGYSGAHIVGNWL